MNRRLLFIFAVAIILLFIGLSSLWYYNPNKTAPSKNQPPVACTQEAKQCPDGSYVGRTGPNCEFSQCPSATSTTPKNSGMVEGNMKIGPICPVEQVGHPCNPTVAMYASHPIFIYSSDKSILIKTLTPDASGDFSATLPVGSYFVDTQHQSVGAVQGVPAVISIISGEITTLTISIDTGIR